MQDERRFPDEILDGKFPGRRKGLSAAERASITRQEGGVQVLLKRKAWGTMNDVSDPLIYLRGVSDVVEVQQRYVLLRLWYIEIDRWCSREIDPT